MINGASRATLYHCVSGKIFPLEKCVKFVCQNAPFFHSRSVAMATRLFSAPFSKGKMLPLTQCSLRFDGIDTPEVCKVNNNLKEPGPVTLDNMYFKAM